VGLVWLEHLGHRRAVSLVVYATFGRTAEELDHPVAPAEDERDNVLNVAPHVEWVENGLYEFLPAMSNGSGVPSPAARTELTTVHLKPGTEGVFEKAVAAARPSLKDETLWYRMAGGGAMPRYVRLRPKPSLSGVLEGLSQQALPHATNDLVARSTVEILSLRPTMSLGLER